MKFTDGKRKVEIEILARNHPNENYYDWTADFYNIGGLEYDAAEEQYKVNDIEYLIEQAKDWKEKRGDFLYDEGEEEREIYIYEY